MKQTFAPSFSVFDGKTRRIIPRQQLAKLAA
jgi:hypothetical protein